MLFSADHVIMAGKREKKLLLARAPLLLAFKVDNVIITPVSSPVIGEGARAVPDDFAKSTGAPAECNVRPRSTRFSTSVY